MTPDQMLWHLSQFLEFALGEGSHQRQKSPIPLPIMRFFLIYMPWPKCAHASVGEATGDARLDAERTRCLALIDRFVKHAHAEDRGHAGVLRP